MAKINVVPSRAGLLVSRADRPRDFIGHRVATPDDKPEAIAIRAEGGRAYVATGRATSVEASAYYTRRIAQKDLVQLSDEDAAVLNALVDEAEAPPAETITTTDAADAASEAP